eukprot:1161027-Pelagomonas_calceolata.AAC.7
MAACTDAMSEQPLNLQYISVRTSMSCNVGVLKRLPARGDHKSGVLVTCILQTKEALALTCGFLCSDQIVRFQDVKCNLITRLPGSCTCLHRLRFMDCYFSLEVLSEVFCLQVHHERQKEMLRSPSLAVHHNTYGASRVSWATGEVQLKGARLCNLFVFLGSSAQARSRNQCSMAPLLSSPEALHC